MGKCYRSDKTKEKNMVKDYSIVFSDGVSSERATIARVIEYATNRLKANPHDAIDFIIDNGDEDLISNFIGQATKKMSLKKAKEVIRTYDEDVLCIKGEK